MTLIRIPKIESGLTLVETLSSLVVFTLVTLGVVPLLLGSLRGASIARSTTIGKTIAQKALERARGLPYFLSISAQASRVDVLDVYYPDDASAGAGTSYSAGKFTTTCPGAATPRACPPGVPSGYTLTFEAEFVRPGAIVAGEETFDVVLPPGDGSYAWNASNNLDQPPSQLLRLAITSSWTVSGAPRSVRLVSLIGDRKLGTDKLRAFARVDHTVEVLTSFTDSAGLTSDLVAAAGIADARIETRILSASEVFVRTGDGRLVQAAVGPVPAVELSRYTGATSILRAPPDVNPGTPSSDSSDLNNFVTHTDPTIGNVAFYDTSRTASPLRAVVAAELPAAEGGFELDSSGVSLEQGFWVDNQALTGILSPLRLDATKPIIFVQKKGTEAGLSMLGSVSAVAGNPAAGDKRVQSTATATMGRLSVFPVDFIANTGAVVRITDFFSTVDCKTTGTTAGFATPTFSATLEYFREDNVNDGVASGSYTPLGLASTNAIDPLAGLFKTQTTVTGPLANHPNLSNPMVYEVAGDLNANGHVNDIYLFPVEHAHNVDPVTGACLSACHSHPGYMDVWGSKFNVAGALAEEGKKASARIDGAISITTTRSSPNEPGSGLVISVGKLSCDAIDNR